jgi:hypothetical protein
VFCPVNISWVKIDYRADFVEFDRHESALGNRFCLLALFRQRKDLFTIGGLELDLILHLTYVNELPVTC